DARLERIQEQAGRRGVERERNQRLSFAFAGDERDAVTAQLLEERLRGLSGEREARRRDVGRTHPRRRVENEPDVRAAALGGFRRLAPARTRQGGPQTEHDDRHEDAREETAARRGREARTIGDRRRDEDVAAPRCATGDPDEEEETENGDER